MIRTIRTSVLAFTLVAALGCKKTEKQQGEPATAAAPSKVTDPAAQAGSAAAGAAGSAVATVQAKVDQAKDVVASADKPALTPEAYEKLIVGLEGCTIKGWDLDDKCPGKVALDDGLKNSKTGLQDIAGLNANVGKKLLGHAAAPVRLYAASIMGGVLGSDASSQDAIVEAAAKETDTGVLQSMIRTVASSGAKNEKVAKLLLDSTSHASPDVRKQAIYAVGSPWNREMKGGAERLAAMIADEKDGEVRAAACKYAGQLGAKSLVAVYDKHTAKVEDPKFYAACMEGLLDMFHDYPHYATAEEGAYKLFLKRLGAKPRTKDTPPWSLMSAFQYYGQSGDSLEGWKKKATWFKPTEVNKAFGEIVADNQANWMARTGAVKSMVALGAKKAELEALRKKLGDTPAGDDTHVARSLDEAIAKAP